MNRQTRISRKLTLAVVAVFAALLLIPPTASAQTAEGRIVGFVIDQSNAFVPGITVVVRNERTGEERKAVSSGQGRYVVASLKPSTYTVTVVAPNFAKLEYTALPLTAGQELNLDLSLSPAGVTENVEVVGQIPIVDLSSARIGANVEGREVEGLPINGRQMAQLYLQAPGSLNSGTGTFSDIRFSGRANEQNVIRYDGIEGSAIIDASPGNLNGEIPSPFRLQSSLENVQEFRVESNSYPAESGTGTGGQISVITKSGANAVHGSGFWYGRNGRLDAPNAFDLNGQKSPLTLNQFGASLGGPIAKNRAFFFGSYEGYRLKSGINIIEAVPSAAAWARAVPAVAALRPAFLSSKAVILPGASANPDFDIAQVQDNSTVNEDAFSGRLDFKLGDNWSAYARYFTDRGVNAQPEGVTGRVVNIEATPANGVFALQGVLGGGTVNEFKVGYNSATTAVNGIVPVVAGADVSAISVNLSGSVTNAGIAGQSGSSGIAIAGGLIRQNSAFNGRGTPYKPYSLSFIDTVSHARGRHFFKAGGEVRLIRMTTDRLGGTTYSYANLTDFLANKAATVVFLGDVSAPSAFNNGATGPRHTVQDYYIGYVQDEWKLRPDFTLNYGVRYDYYAPLRERNNLVVKFDTATGVILPNTTPLYASKKDNIQPRVAFSFAPGSGNTVLRGGFGIYVGPGQTEDQIQPVESDRVSSTLSSVSGAYPISSDVFFNNFTNDPNNRKFQPRAYAPEYTIPEKVYQYSLGVQRQFRGNLVASASYVGSQGRNLFLRSFTNKITTVLTNADPTKSALVIREFDIVNPDGTISTPFAEVDYKTSGGHDNYNALQLSLTKRTKGLALNAQYTLGRSFGNTGGSNEAQTAGDPYDFNYDNGYNNFDVRHTFNLSALWSLPFGRGRRFLGDAGGVAEALLGGWDVGAIVNARSGLPLNILVVRPDVVYLDSLTGVVYTNPAAGRTAVINTLGGGSSRNVRRPNLVPGVDPYLKNGLQWLNPAAFSAPAPGEFGNLERGALRGPGFKQVDMVFAKRFATGGRSNAEFRVEVFNIFNTTNYAQPVTTLPQALPSSTYDATKNVQPDQPYSAATAGTFGTLTSTVGRTVGLGTNRQVQLALRFTF